VGVPAGGTTVTVGVGDTVGVVDAVGVGVTAGGVVAHPAMNAKIATQRSGIRMTFRGVIVP